MTTTTLRRAIRSILNCVPLYRRGPAPAPAPETTADVMPADIDVQKHIPEQIPVSVDESMPALEEDLGEAVAPVPDDPRDWLSASRIPVSTEACQEPTPDSMQWWASHSWICIGFLFRCRRCERLWPEPYEE